MGQTYRLTPGSPYQGRGYYLAGDVVLAPDPLPLPLPTVEAAHLTLSVSTFQRAPPAVGSVFGFSPIRRYRAGASANGSGSGATIL